MFRIAADAAPPELAGTLAAVDPDPSEAGGARPGRAQRRWWLAAAVALAVSVLSVMSLASLEPARAIPINPLDETLGAGVDAITEGVGGMAVESLETICKTAVCEAGEADQPRAAWVAGRGPRLRDPPRDLALGR